MGFSINRAIVGSEISWSAPDAVGLIHVVIEYRVYSTIQCAVLAKLNS